MKYMIASDIHGSSYYCQKLMDAYKYEKPDRLILLGDILYHGPRNDLPKDYAPKKVIEMLNPYQTRFYVFVEIVIVKSIKWYWIFHV